MCDVLTDSLYKSKKKKKEEGVLSFYVFGIGWLNDLYNRFDLDCTDKQASL